MIDNFDWSSLAAWQSKFLSLIQECFLKGVLPKRRHVPWISKQIRSAICKRNLLYRKSRISGSASLFIKYKIARNKVATMLRREKQSYMPGLGNANATHL